MHGWELRLAPLLLPWRDFDATMCLPSTPKGRRFLGVFFLMQANHFRGIDITVNMTTKHVLVADDNFHIRKAVCLIVAADKRFHPCSEAENGQKAVEFAAKEHPNVVVMDYSMPVMNGMEASRLIKHADPSITIVLLSMHSDLVPVDVLDASGISAAVSKERAATDLIPKLASLLRLDSLVA